MAAICSPWPEPAEHDAAIGLAAHHRAADGGADRRVVDGLGGVRAEVERLVAEAPSSCDEVRLQLARRRGRRRWPPSCCCASRVDSAGQAELDDRAEQVVEQVGGDLVVGPAPADRVVHVELVVVAHAEEVFAAARRRPDALEPTVERLVAGARAAACGLPQRAP